MNVCVHVVVYVSTDSCGCLHTSHLLTNPLLHRISTIHSCCLMANLVMRLIPDGCRHKVFTFLHFCFSSVLLHYFITFYTFL